MSLTKKDFDDLYRDAMRWREISKIVETVKPNFSHQVRRGPFKDEEGRLYFKNVRVYTVDLQFIGDSLADAIDQGIKERESQEGGV